MLENNTISIHFVYSVVKAAKRKGLNYQLLLQRANLNEELLNEPQLRITPKQFSQLVQEMWVLADDEFLCMSTQACRSGVFALMARQAIYCHNLQKIYRHLVKFYSLITDTIQLEFNIIGDEAHFSMVLKDPTLDPDNTLREFLMIVWHRFPSWLIGKLIPLKYIQLDYKQPVNVAEYHLMYPCEAKFEQAKNTLVFDISLLRSVIQQPPDSLGNYLRRAPLDWFTRQTYHQKFTQQVANYLEHNESFENTNMEQVALQLHITTRTLRRKLLKENTSFQELKDDSRRDKAIHLLNQPNIPISQISHQLDYSEPTAFSRAFKGWTGVTPKIFRGNRI